MPEPIKRHIALQPLSREHHQGLLLSWKIREGLRLGVEVDRIRHYVSWFWKMHLRSHFAFEEKHIFPLLGETHPMVQRALDEHQQLQWLVEQVFQREDSLHTIESLLVKHIRFEERSLFNEVERVTPEMALHEIEALHQPDQVGEAWEDPFWIKKK